MQEVSNYFIFHVEIRGYSMQKESIKLKELGLNHPMISHENKDHAKLGRMGVLLEESKNFMRFPQRG